MGGRAYSELLKKTAGMAGGLRYAGMAGGRIEHGRRATQGWNAFYTFINHMSKRYRNEDF